MPKKRVAKPSLGPNLSTAELNVFWELPEVRQRNNFLVRHSTSSSCGGALVLPGLPSVVGLLLDEISPDPLPISQIASIFRRYRLQCDKCSRLVGRQARNSLAALTDQRRICLDTSGDFTQAHYFRVTKGPTLISLREDRPFPLNRPLGAPEPVVVLSRQGRQRLRNEPRPEPLPEFRSGRSAGEVLEEAFERMAQERNGPEAMLAEPGFPPPDFPLPVREPEDHEELRSPTESVFDRIAHWAIEQVPKPRPWKPQKRRAKARRRREP